MKDSSPAFANIFEIKHLSVHELKFNAWVKLNFILTVSFDLFLWL